MIRVLVASQSAGARARLEALLRAQPGIELAAGADDADAIVLDWDRGEEPELPAAPVIVLARDAAITREALRGGARAVLPREAGPEELVAAIQAAAGGLVALAPEAVEALLAQGPRTAAAPTAEELTPREIEVLRLLAEGDANKEIAWRLGISEHTVKFHVASILGKLGAASRTEAVTAGIRRGLILL